MSDPKLDPDGEPDGSSPEGSAGDPEISTGAPSPAGHDDGEAAAAADEFPEESGRVSTGGGEDPSKPPRASGTPVDEGLTSPCSGLSKCEQISVGDLSIRPPWRCTWQW
mmetsp:Transcript_45488/g.145984  ORF Transcript_45488/g.145984 Transcript_45488/m.145984 type:complete len:109 (+) Transcript_45488:2306-2632(+)